MHTGKRAVIAIGALAVLLPFGGSTSAAVVVDPATAVAATSTPIDWAIDIAVRLRVVADKLSPASALIAREQLQFQYLALPAAEQARILAMGQRGSSDLSAASMMEALKTASVAKARQVATDATAAVNTSPNTQSGPTAKLGPASPDLVFVATQGPCRVLDTRNGPGQLAAFTARQVWVSSNGPGYSWALDQGGTGSAGAGNCVGTVFNYVTAIPVSVVATVTATNTTNTGSLQAWDGGTTLSGGAVVNWLPFERLTNTTVIPMNRFIVAFPGSGSKRDIGLNNNSNAPIDIVIDVLGYFIENSATALDCTTVDSSATALPAMGFNSTASPSCPANYTRVVTTCFPSDYFVNQVGVSGNTCFMRSEQAFATSYTATSVCCRVPGI